MQAESGAIWPAVIASVATLVAGALGVWNKVLLRRMSTESKEKLGLGERAFDAQERMIEALERRLTAKEQEATRLWDRFRETEDECRKQKDDLRRELMSVKQLASEAQAGHAACRQEMAELEARLAKLENGRS